MYESAKQHARSIYSEEMTQGFLDRLERMEKALDSIALPPRRFGLRWTAFEAETVEKISQARRDLSEQVDLFSHCQY